MADEELFSLCWNNFNTNLSAGFHESLVNGDLVDVTLAAEGQLVKAHRLVLSVCSPYFRKMFTNMPANQHAFVFLKDVTHSALKELIQFMYCGEVNVKQEALPAFISTAEALQIKGLTDSGDPAPPPLTSPVKLGPSTHSSASSPTRGRTQQRNITRTTYKMESEDSADERSMIQVHTQKRSAPRSTVALQSIPSTKRTKIESLEQVETTTDTGVTTRMSEKSEAEFIDLPITEALSAKAEPVEEYTEDTAEDIEQEGEATYVEEDTYGDMKYDESYFTENDESGATSTKQNVSGFSETFAEGDQSVAEAQEKKLSNKRRRGTKNVNTTGRKPPAKVDIQKLFEGPSHPMELVSAKFGGMKVAFQGHHYAFHFSRRPTCNWRCLFYNQTQCEAKIVTKNNRVYVLNGEHNHEEKALADTNDYIPETVELSAPEPAPKILNKYVKK